MNFYPFRKFKINNKQLFPVLNNKNLYPQHSTDEEIDFLNQCFENVSFSLIYAIFANSQYAAPAFCFKIDEQEIFIKYEILLDKFNKLTIDKGIIKNKMIFVSCGLKISVVFDYEEDFSFYHTELLAQGNSEIFKTKEKDLKIGAICSSLNFEGSRLTYLGKKYYRNIRLHEMSRNNMKQIKIYVTSFTKPFHVFEYIDRFDRQVYVFRKDLKNIHYHQWADLITVEEIKASEKIVSDELLENQISPADIASYYDSGLLDHRSYHGITFEEIEFDEETFSYARSEQQSIDTSYKY